jgi:hypothetical protein
MNPYLIAPPAAPPVPMVDLRAHLRIDGEHDDALIASLQDAAVAHLDGWRGVLGRCIVAQTWGAVVEGPGPHLLPMPDVIEVVATAGDDPVPVETEMTVRGLDVTLPDFAGRAVISFTCEMPAQQRPAVDAAIKLLVGHWYQHREAAGPSMHELPMAVGALIGALRWRHS